MWDVWTVNSFWWATLSWDWVCDHWAYAAFGGGWLACALMFLLCMLGAEDGDSYAY